MIAVSLEMSDEPQTVDKHILVIYLSVMRLLMEGNLFKYRILIVSPI